MLAIRLQPPEWGKGVISISMASSPEDFQAVTVMCDRLADLDASIHAEKGIPPDLVFELFHRDDNPNLAELYVAPAAMFLARWDGQPAGCLGFAPHDETADELHRFYVDPAFRKKGIGKALIEAVFAGITAGNKRRIVLQTSVYLPDAIRFYQASGFAFCPPFRSVHTLFTETEVFMSCLLDPASDR
jgi:GNAT superfamily N-acetyltransferase